MLLFQPAVVVVVATTTVALVDYIQSLKLAQIQLYILQTNTEA